MTPKFHQTIYAAVLLCTILLFERAYGQSTGISTFAQWQQTVFTTVQINDPTISGPQADPDGDGIVNLLEYAEGSDPLTANVQSTTSKFVGGYLTFSFSRRVAATDISYVVEVSNDLVNWASGPGYTTQTQTVDGASGFEIVSVSNNTLSSSTARQFMRLRIVVGQSLPSPSGLITSASSQTTNHLSWVNNTTNSGGILIERSVDGGQTWTTVATLDPTANTYDDSSIAPNTSYTYRVTALAQNSGAGGGSSGSSLPSGSSTVTPPSSPTPKEFVELDLTKVAMSTDSIDIYASVFNQTDPIASLSIYDVSSGTRTKILDVPANEGGDSYYYSHVQWANAGSGIHYLLALATDSLGNTLASPVYRIEVVQYVQPASFSPYPNPNPLIVTDQDQSALAYYEGATIEAYASREPPPPDNSGLWTEDKTTYQWSGDCVDSDGNPNPTDYYSYLDTSSTGAKSVSVTETTTWKLASGAPGNHPTTTLSDTFNFDIVDVQINMANAQPLLGQDRGVSTDLVGTVPFSLNVSGAQSGDGIRMNCDLTNFKVWAVQNGTRTRVSPSQVFDATNLPTFEVEATSDAYDFISQGAIFDLKMDYLTSTGVVPNDLYSYDEAPLIHFNHFIAIDVFPKTNPTTGTGVTCIQVQKLWPDNEGDYAPASVPTGIKIGGTAANYIQQDASDPSIFYFDPDVSSPMNVGSYDLEVDNLSFNNVPVTNAVSKSAVEVTKQVDIGVSAFSTAMNLAIQEAGSIAASVSNQGGSVQDAETAFEEQTDSRVPVFSYLLKSFLSGLTTDSGLDAELQNMVSTGDNTTIYICSTQGFDGGTAAATASTGSSPSSVTTDGTSTPQIGSASFFADVKSYLASSGNKIFQGTFGDTSYLVINADDFQLSTFDLGSYGTGNQIGKIIDDAVAANPQASIIINGAFFNWHANDPNAEPLVTIGVVLNNGVPLPTSNLGKPSQAKSVLAYWFGQTFDHSATTNGGHALTYETGGKGNPPIPAGTKNPTDLNAAIGGLTSLILQDSSGKAYKVSPKNSDPAHGDQDLNVFTTLKGSRTGTGGIGINRANGMIIIFAKTSHYSDVFPQTVFDIQTTLFSSGVDTALLTDGGSSVALAVSGKVIVREGRHNPSARPGIKDTVTDYFVFKPNN